LIVRRIASSQPTKWLHGKKNNLVTKVPAHHLYRRTDFHSRVKLCVTKILLTSLKAANRKAFSHRAKFFFPICGCVSTLK
jgi:hypothetical protein